MILFLSLVAINLTHSDAYHVVVTQEIRKKSLVLPTAFKVYTVYLTDAVRGSQINATLMETAICETALLTKLSFYFFLPI